MTMQNNPIQSNGEDYTMSLDEEDERDSVDDQKSARAAMHSSILEPIEMPEWVGGRRKSSFASVDYSDSSTNDFWNHRGTRVDPSTLKFASDEPPEEPQTGFRLPMFQNNKNDEEDSDDEYNKAHVMKQKSETDWNAFVKDVTVAPSKQEGQGIDFFFGMMNRRNQSIQKDQPESTNKQEKGLLGAMLDRASNSSLPASGASPSVAAASATSKSDRSVSIVSDGFPSWTKKTTEDSTRSIPVTSNSPKNEKDDCSNGSIGSSASWDPCEDIWDEDMDITSKRVEAERRIVTKRTGKELWQIVRDNRTSHYRQEFKDTRYHHDEQEAMEKGTTTGYFWAKYERRDRGGTQESRTSRRGTEYGRWASTCITCSRRESFYEQVTQGIKRQRPNEETSIQVKKRRVVNQRE